MLRNTQLMGRRGGLTALVSLAIALAVSACGSGDAVKAVTKKEEGGSNRRTETTVVREVTGTVATGAPAQGTVTAVDADGNTTSDQTDANGVFVLDLGGRTGPFLLRFEPANGQGAVMYSFVNGSRVVNITPLTQLALVLAYHTSLQEAFTNWASVAATFKRGDLEAAMARINANFATDLLNAGVDPKVYDFFTTAFTADGTGIDAVLDNYRVSTDAGGSSYSVTDRSGNKVAFNENIDTTGYAIGARFLIDGLSYWNYTYTTVSAGKESTQTRENMPAVLIPWSEERFWEIFWYGLPLSLNQQINCKDDPDVVCDITVRVTRLDGSYDVTGNGEVGTVITASGGYEWSMKGWYSYRGLFRKDIDEKHTSSFSWRWERVQ